jgi:hypothetical protein
MAPIWFESRPLLGVVQRAVIAMPQIQQSADGSSWILTAFHKLELGRFDNEDAARGAATLLHRDVAASPARTQM